MSEHWQPPRFVAWGRSGRPAFVPWGADRAGPIEMEIVEEAPCPEEIEAIRAAAYQEGLAAAKRDGDTVLALERDALARLADSLKALQPESSGPLALLLVETVDTLVRQVVGEVAIDPALLLSRAQAAAQMVADGTKPTAIRLNPADHARLEGATLPLPAVADANVRPGDVVLETGEGWIEDGLAARLDAVRAALSRMLAK